MKKYDAVNIMGYDPSENDQPNTFDTSLSDEYTKTYQGSEFWPKEKNGKICKYQMSLSQIQNKIMSKKNIDLFCKNNPECYGLVFRMETFEPDSEVYFKNYIPTPETLNSYVHNDPDLREVSPVPA